MTEPSDLARQAMDSATSAHAKIDSHEDICAIRYQHLEDGLKRLTNLVGWGGATLAAVILAVLGWAMTALFDANDRAIEALQHANEAVVQSEPPSRGNSRIPVKEMAH